MSITKSDIKLMGTTECPDTKGLRLGSAGGLGFAAGGTTECPDTKGLRRYFGAAWATSKRNNGMP